MITYTTIEEKFCSNADKNVVLETTHFADGTRAQHCLNQHNCTNGSCNNRNSENK